MDPKTKDSEPLLAERNPEDSTAIGVRTVADVWSVKEKAPVRHTRLTWGFLVAGAGFEPATFRL